MAEQTAQVLTFFWQSEFNLYEGEQYLRAEHAHKRLKHVWAWEEATRDNPAFILEALFERSREHPTLEHLWHVFRDAGQQEMFMTYDALVARAMEDGEIKLRRVITDFVRQVSTERRFPRTIRESLEGELTQMTNGVVGLVSIKGDELVGSADSHEIKQKWTEAFRNATVRVVAGRLREQGVVHKISNISHSRLVEILERHGN